MSKSVPRVTREFEKFAAGLGKTLQDKKKNFLTIGKQLEDSNNSNMCNAEHLYDELDKLLDNKLNKEDTDLIEKNIPLTDGLINYVDFYTIITDSLNKQQIADEASNKGGKKKKTEESQPSEEEDDAD